MKGLILFPLLCQQIPIVELEQTNEPVIELYCNGESVDSTLSIYEDQILSVSIQSDSFKSAYVSIDGQVSNLNEEDEILISKVNQLLIFTAIDQEGKQSTRTLLIQPLSIPTFSTNVENGAWINDPQISLYYSDNMDEQWQLVVEYENKKDVMEPVDHLNLVRNGSYRMYLEHKEKIELHSESISFYFSNVQPSLSIIPTATYTNEPVDLMAQWDGINLVSKVWTISSQLGDETYSMDQVPHLEGLPGQEIIYTVVASVTDVFGQKAEATTTVCIDRKPPLLSLRCNGKDVKEGKVNVFANDQFDIDSEYNPTLTFQKNGLPVFYASFHDALSHLQGKDVLNMTISVEDDAGNQVIKSWAFSKNQVMPDLKSLPMSSLMSLSSFYFDENQQWGQRIWSLDENNRVAMKRVAEDSLFSKKPKVSILVRKEKRKSYVRVVLYRTERGKERFTKIRVNQKAIPLKKVKLDRLGHFYYEFLIKDHKADISVKARSKQGAIRHVQKTVYARSNQNRFFSFLEFLISTLFYG